MRHWQRPGFWPMPRSRPAHVRERSITSPAFDDLAMRIRTAEGHRDGVDRYVEGQSTETTIRVATAPGSTDEETERHVENDSYRLSHGRSFWCEAGAPLVGNRVRWPVDGGLTYDVVNASTWNGITAAIGVRRDG